MTEIMGFISAVRSIIEVYTSSLQLKLPYRTQRFITNPLMKIPITEETKQFNQLPLSTNLNETFVVLLR